MSSGRIFAIALVLVFVGAMAAGPVAAGAEQVKLGPRHIDPVHGFSLCPPADAQRDQGVSTNRLARWVKRDAKTGAIAWQLTVRKEVGAGATSLADLTNRLKLSLGRMADVKVDKVAQTKVAGLDGIETAIVQGTRSKRWQHELWVQRSPGDLLVLSINGTFGLKKDMDDVLTAVAETWKISDPKALAELRKESLQRGEKLLAGITADKLKAAVAGEEQWLLCRHGDSDIGFMRITARQTKRNRVDGVEVRTRAKFTMPDGRKINTARNLFASADRRTEQWSQNTTLANKTGAALEFIEKGTYDGGLITCDFGPAANRKTRKKPLEPAAARNYLPHAFAVLLPKLVDLSTPAAYGFASYTAAANDIDLRTFTVVGPTEVTVGTNKVRGIHATDQLAADTAPATLELDKDGSLLRMSSDAGIVMEQSTRQAVLRRYPDAEE